MKGVVLGSNGNSQFVKTFASKFFYLDGYTPNTVISRTVKLQDGLNIEFSLSEDSEQVKSKNIDVYFVLLDLNKSVEQLNEEVQQYSQQLKEKVNPKALQVFIGHQDGLVEDDMADKGQFLIQIMNKIKLCNKNQKLYILDIKNRRALEEVLIKALTIALALKPAKYRGLSALEEKTAPLVEDFKSFIFEKIQEMNQSKKGFQFFKSNPDINKILFLEDLKADIKYPIAERLSTFFDRYPADSFEDLIDKQLIIDEIYQEFMDIVSYGHSCAL